MNFVIINDTAENLIGKYNKIPISHNGKNGFGWDDKCTGGGDFPKLLPIPSDFPQIYLWKRQQGKSQVAITWLQDAATS